MNLSTDYLAGVIDGEGTITLQRKHKKDSWRTPAVSVSSTTPELLHALVGTFGGHICKHKTYKAHHMPAYSWRVIGRKALVICAHICSKLLVPEKRRRAELIAHDYLKCTPRNGKYTPEQVAQKTRFEADFFTTAS